MVNPPNNFKTMNNEINTLNRQKEAILLLDNYDSFTYNLAHLVKELGGNKRQPKVSWEFVWAIRPSAKHSEPHSKI